MPSHAAPIPEQHGASVIVTAPAPAGVVITAETIWTEVRATHDQMIVLTERIGTLADHEKRLRTVERRQLTASGAAGVLGAGVALIASHLIGKW